MAPVYKYNWLHRWQPEPRLVAHSLLSHALSFVPLFVSGVGCVPRAARAFSDVRQGGGLTGWRPQAARQIDHKYINPDVTTLSSIDIVAERTHLSPFTKDDRAMMSIDI